MPWKVTALILALQPLACGWLHAQQTPEPTALTTTRAAFLRQVMTDSQLLTEQYERALSRVEAEVSASGAYEEAHAIRQRREQLQALYSGTVSSLATPLPLAQARLTGSAQASGETLSGWRSNGSGAEWMNFRLVPGAYHLEFEVNMSDAPITGSIYASSKLQPQKTAVFEFNEVTVLGASIENRRTFEIFRSADETTFSTVRVSALNFTSSPVTLRLHNTTGYPANLIRIRNLRLVPVSEEATPEVAGDIADEETLKAATSTLRKAIDDARQAAAKIHIDNLQALAKSKPELKDQVEAEDRRVRQLLDRSTGPEGIRAVTSAASGLNGFEDISNARLAEGIPLAGDRFTVVHDGAEFPVRLLWVRCPPADENDPAVARLAAHFKIADEDAAAIGRAAREFTAGYLRDKPLRLLVRADKDKDGTLPALLFLPEVGLYQNLLVEHGLAAVATPTRNTKRNATEKAIIDTLTEREKEAMTRDPAPGAWALQSALTKGGEKP
ncbi:MAG: hypothetical protein R3F13_21125 [Prosthecobacter sp.]